MSDSFVFVADGRTFTCSIETSAATRGEAWWWFTVTGDGQRYAAFRPSEGEAHSSVQTRIAQYYADRLEREAAELKERFNRSVLIGSYGRVASRAVCLPRGAPRARSRSAEGFALPQHNPQHDENEDGAEAPAAEFLRAISCGKTTQQLAHRLLRTVGTGTVHRLMRYTSPAQ